MSYQSIARRTCGERTSGFTQVVLLINLYGTIVSYMMAAGVLVE